MGGLLKGAAAIRGAPWCSFFSLPLNLMKEKDSIPDEKTCFSGNGLVRCRGTPS